MYRLKPNITQGIKAPKDKLLTKYTIDSFCNTHGEEYKQVFKTIKSTLHKIIKHEKVVIHDDIKIYYHTYNVLFILFRYLTIIDFYNSPEYKNTFAGMRGSKADMLNEYHKYRANVLDSSNAFKGDDRVKASILKNFYFDRESTDIFINFYSLNPVSQIKVPEGDEFFKSIFDKIIYHFSSTYIESEDVIYKSLAIYLNAYFRISMDIKAKFAKQITEDILSELFDFTFSASSADLLRNVYVSGRLDSMPIFKHAKEALQIDEKVTARFDAYFKELDEEFTDLDNIPITAEQYLSLNPVKQFLLLKPMEFLEEI